MAPPRFLRPLVVLLLTLTYSAQGQDAESCTATDGSCSSCYDDFQDCLTWAESGECTNNPTFMTESCPMSCEYCSGGKLASWENKECLDLHPKCSDWAGQGECVGNPGYMKQGCKRSCLTCINIKQEREEGMDEDEIQRRFRFVSGNWGPQQDYGGTAGEKSKIKGVLLGMREYALHNVTGYPFKERLLCKNEKQECGFWAGHGECESNLNFMMLTCPLACQFCDKKMRYEECSGKKNSKPSIPDGGIQKTYEHLKSLEQVELVSEAEVKENNDPWVLKIDNFVTDEEADALVAVAKGLTWQPSSSVSSASLKETSFVRRLSQSAVGKDCQDEAYTKLEAKLSELVKVESKFVEPLEFVHYTKMQSFGMHHDFNLHDLWLPVGPRVLSMFLCLTDVPEGGAMGFPDLDWLLVPPKKGQLLIWPNVLSEHTRKRHPDMASESLPVLKGEKYGVHTWVRLHDYERAEKMGCV
mmetsp:Transcript_12532/g.20867  ORF Transcript_12532/g.20867 Transcript_12532/m.20867 type:complete len:470 (-) Transcript_12532:99-1508(-)|eukprot:CAMPEP_0119010186 /NCGR_PEP_ID=MMETSP1176-20130426/4850_1 /TAXON_ID=265551 /ORGANISM="Synedropsis recta cf, Strain CCMP1620" /LENGTH=469 /DNA_ID=CAMNT_0006962813 /DNA_START=56 /DNA_END=1465 /DNA_ORIENTATION=-